MGVFGIFGFGGEEGPDDGDEEEDAGDSGGADEDGLARIALGEDHHDMTVVVRGAESVARRALMFSRMAPHVRPALVNGAPGVVVIPPDGKVFSIMAFTVADGKIVEIDALVDPERLAGVDLSALEGA